MEPPEINDEALDAAGHEPPEVVVLRKWQLALGVLAGLLIPPTTLIAGYYHAQGVMEDKINAIQLQNVETFAKNQDVKDMTAKVDQIASDVSEIKGFLFQRHGKH